MKRNFTIFSVTLANKQGEKVFRGPLTSVLPDTAVSTCITLVNIAHLLLDSKFGIKALGDPKSPLTTTKVNLIYVL